MEQEKIYSFSNERLSDAFMQGIELREDMFVSEGEGYAVLPYIDGGKNSANWGRLHIDIKLSLKSVCIVYAAALSELPEEGRKLDEDFFKAVGAECFINKEDMLLYSLEGRYLFIMLFLKGEGYKAAGSIRVYARGDFLIDMFPEIYKKRNSFLHRYLSIFSSMHQNMEEKIDRLPELLMPDKAPLDMLPTLAEWMGLDLSGVFLEEEALRGLVKEAYSLNKKRGTKEALRRIAKLLTGEIPIIVERNLIPKSDDKEREKIENFLYGEDIYDVTVMITEEKKQCKKSQLLFLMDQLKPARCRLRLISLKKSAGLDGYIYLDINGRICGESGREVLDAGFRLH